LKPKSRRVSPGFYIWFHENIISSNLEKLPINPELIGGKKK
jgi:hypothetical protein